MATDPRDIRDALAEALWLNWFEAKYGEGGAWDCVEPALKDHFRHEADDIIAALQHPSVSLKIVREG